MPQTPEGSSRLTARKQLIAITRRKLRDALLAVDRLEKNIEADGEPQGQSTAPSLK